MFRILSLSITSLQTDSVIMGSIRNLKEEMLAFKNEMRNEMAFLKIEMERKSRKVCFV